MRANLLAIGACLGALALSAPANAATVIVDAKLNSSSGGSGAATGLTLAAGQLFSVTAGALDLWSAGALPRFSNANGLTGNILAVAGDDSGQAPGTLIGINYGGWSQNGLTAPYGALVGRIGNVYRLLGANFLGQAWGSGALSLYYWDSNSGDNTGFITANVAAVPEPATWLLLVAGMGLLGCALRQRRVSVTNVRYRFT